MIRLGLQLTLHSGREAFTRLLLTTVAVALGVAVLLGVFAEFHAFQADANRSCWECTQGATVPKALGTRGELWNYSADFYQGRTIERLDLAALGSGAPVPPGVSRLPGPGQYYASPALAALLRTVPRDELGDRFPGTMIGTIGDAALTGPDELAIYVGYQPSSLAAVPGTQLVTDPAGHAGTGGLHPVLPVRVRRRRARGAVPHLDPDRHGHPAGGGAPRGAVRRAAAGRGDAAGHQRHRLGRLGGEHDLRRDRRDRPVPGDPARAGRRRAHRHQVLRRHGEPRPPGCTSPCWSRCRPRRRSRRWSRCAGCGSRRSASAAGPPRRRRRRGGWPRWAPAWRCSWRGCSRPTTSPSARRPIQGC